MSRSSPASCHAVFRFASRRRWLAAARIGRSWAMMPSWNIFSALLSSSSVTQCSHLPLFASLTLQLIASFLSCTQLSSSSSERGSRSSRTQLALWHWHAAWSSVPRPSEGHLKSLSAPSISAAWSKLRLPSLAACHATTSAAVIFGAPTALAVMGCPPRVLILAFPFDMSFSFAFPTCISWPSTKALILWHVSAP